MNKGWRPIVAFKRDSNYVPTNADGIRLMSDEQLANVMASVETGVNTYGDDVYSHWLSWLKAADAIEELQAAVSGYEATTDVEFVKEDGHERIRFVPKWIPVTERLPEEPGDYLVYVVGGEWRQLSWIDIDYFNGEKFRGGKWTTANPVAWMPLPEPPKEDEA